MNSGMVSEEAQTPTPTASPRNLGETLLWGLRDAGVRELFGIPGDFILPFFKTIESSGILPLYTLSHEPSIGFAADGAARVCCRPSAAVVTYGAGALNMVNSIAAAYAEKSPVVVISGGPGTDENHTELLLHHQAKRLDSQYQIYREVTCAQARLRNPWKAPFEISRVLSECISQSRPVYIELPRNQVVAPCGEPQPLCKPNDVHREALAACVDELMTTLRRADHPVLMVGAEVRRFRLETQVARLADALGIPVVTSFMGRGLLAGRETRVLGTYMGIAGDPHITGMVENSDALLLLGVILSDTNLGTSQQKINLNRCILALDRQVKMGYHVYPDIPLDQLVQAILNQLPENLATAPFKADSLPVSRAVCNMPIDDAAIQPDDVAMAINDLLRDRGPLQVVTDVGDCLFVAMDIEDAELAAPGYYASMGFAVPAGMGIQIASGRRALILLGDGAFQMTGWELGNCSRYGLDPIVVVLNNSAWEMLRAFEPNCAFNTLPEWRFADLATSLGGHGMRVHRREQLHRALVEAMDQRGTFHLIEVMISGSATSRTMGQYVKGIRGLRARNDSNVKD